MFFKEYEKLLTPPIARAAYSDRTAWLMAEMSKFAYIKFENNDSEREKLKNEIKKANFELVDVFNTSTSSDTLSGTQAFLALRNTPKDNKIRIKQNYVEIARSCRLIKEMFSDIDIGIECHSLEEYCTKLGQYALQRL